MKLTKVRIASFIMSTILIFSAALSYSVSVYATSDGGVYEPGTSWWHKFTTEFGSIVRYAANQYNAFVKGDDFSQYLKNQEDFEEWWNTGHISYDDSTNSFTFDEDFGKYFKQALIDYANEMNEFYIVPTNSWHDLDVTKFKYRPQYLTIHYLSDDYGMIAVNGMNRMSLAPMTNYINNGYVFILYDSSYDIEKFHEKEMWVSMYNQNWEYKSSPMFRYFDFSEGQDAYTSFEQGTESTGQAKYFNKFVLNYVTTRNGSIYDWTSSVTGAVCGTIITNDGCRVRVFKSLNSYKLYSVGQRAVYFGSGFYDTEVGDLTASFEDVAQSMDKLDETLRDLLDKIDDNTDEKKIEDLLQQILDQMKDNNSGNNSKPGGNSGDDSKTDELLQQILEQLTNLANSINSGSGSSGSGSSDSKDYTGFFGSILEYLQLIVDYLAGILDGIENLVFLEWTSQDEDIGDLSDIIKGIKDDPETGSQAAADYLTTSFSDIATGLTKKFPFSIPWDLYALFSVFSEVDSPQTISASSDTILPYSIRDGNIQLLDGAGHSRPGIVEPEASNAPYFKLPLVIESAGINENIIIDLSGFQSVSVLSRSLFTVLFALFLLKFTLKIIPLFKGGDGD